MNGNLILFFGKICRDGHEASLKVNNAILFRGYIELYQLDKNKELISVFEDKLDQLWNRVSDKNGLFSKDWKGEKGDEYKWLPDQAGLVEM